MPLTDSFAQLDAIALAQMVQTKAVTPLEVVDCAIARAEAHNPAINAIAERLYDSARAAAKAVEISLPLAGVPFAIKDLYVAAQGVPISSGSRLPRVTAAHDSTLMARYRSAGMIPVCTSTTPEWGLSLMTETARYGITRNPWGTGHTTGGSSGGAAALVAAGVVPVTHASDAGGSIRVPAACTGLVGLKPSRGRVPLTPEQSEGLFGTVVQHALTRSVRDSALLLDLSSTHDPLSPYAAPGPQSGFAAAATVPPKALKIGVYRDSPLSLPISDDTQKALDIAVATVRDAGHSVEQIDLPMIDRSFLEDFATLIAIGFAGRMRELGRGLGRSPLGRLERKTRLVARFGGIIPAARFAETLLRLQARARAVLAHTQAYDSVLMPLIAHPPLPCGRMVPKGIDLLLEQVVDALHLTPVFLLQPVLTKMVTQSLWFTHWPAIQNMTGQPAIALPVHVTAAGLPLGVQAVGRMGDEATLLALAQQMEERLGWTDRAAPMRKGPI